MGQTTYVEFEDERYNEVMVINETTYIECLSLFEQMTSTSSKVDDRQYDEVETMIDECRRFLGVEVTDSLEDSFFNK